MIRGLGRKILAQDDILILTHASPDGDTLGSAVALMHGLIQKGKRAGIYCADEIPDRYEYLFEGLSQPDFEPKYIVSVDVADIKLLGKGHELYQGKIDLAIDHHEYHKSFAEKEWVNKFSAANAEIIFDLLLGMQVNITKEIANALYTGITTDTGCFRYRSVTSQTHRIAAALIGMGASAGPINQWMFETKTAAQVQTEIEAMNSMELLCDNKCAVISINKEMIAKFGVSEDDLGAISSKPREIQGVLIGAVLKEKEDGSVKVSVRTNPPANAGALCGILGGGGHLGAGGCAPEGSLAEVREKIIDTCKDYLQEMNL
jgi:Exopolyphosphatase-related proteins